MKKTKRIIASFLVAIVSTGLLVSCGNKNDAENGVTEVSIWTNFSHSKSVICELVENYNNGVGKEKGIKIIYEVHEGDAGQDIELARTSGNAPDIYSGYSEDGVHDNYFVALDDIEGGKEFCDKYKKFLPNHCVCDGKQYSVPFSATTRGLIINTDMFEEKGIVDENGKAKAPETWAELVEDAIKLTDASKKEFGIIFPMKWGTWVTSDIISPGFSSIGFDGYNPVTGTYDYSGYKPMMDAVMAIKEAKAYFPGAEGLDNDPARSRFSEGGIGMKFGFSWDVSVLNDQFPATINWKVVPYPVVDTNKKYKQIMSVNGAFVINKQNAEKKDINKIFEVYKWLHSDDVITELYANCCDLPVMDGVLKSDTIKNEKKGWKDFCDLVDISCVRVPAMPSETSGTESIAELFINKVWTGEISVDDALSQYTKTMNDGVEKYFQINPDANKKDYIIPEYDVSR